MRGFLEKARGNDLERSEAMIYITGGYSHYISQGGRRWSSIIGWRGLSTLAG